jgi:hypothetical protein
VYQVAPSYSDDEDDTISKATGTLVQNINFDLISCEEYYNNSGKNKADAWLGQEPYLRLYHVIMEDEVKSAYVKVFHVQDHQELVARNSLERPKNFVELASDLYNNQDFNPYTTTYPELHDDFWQTIFLPQVDALQQRQGRLK